MARLLVATTAALALGAGSAHAATVEVRLEYLRVLPVYVAAPGEANDVVVSRVNDRTLRIADPGASISAGDGCRLVDSHTADCTIPDTEVGFARVDAGDRDDTVRATGTTVPNGAGLYANGGPGHDVLMAGGTSGPGNLVSDGDTTGVDVDADELDGGGGRLSYLNRSAP